MSNKVYNYLIRFSFLVIGLCSYNQSAAQRSIEKLLHYFYPSAEDYIYINPRLQNISHGDNRGDRGRKYSKTLDLRINKTNHKN